MRVTADFTGGEVASDGGALILREIDDWMKNFIKDHKAALKNIFAVMQ